jgi:ATP-dependent protease ClpP protease subunit
MLSFTARVMDAFKAAGLPAGLTFRAATPDSPAEILIYDEIGYNGISASAFVAALAGAGAGPVVIRINSPGGDVFDGMAIYNAILAHSGGATTQVDGVAASAASYIALAGRTVTMSESSMMMIHNASALTWGNKADMLAVADTLGKIDGQLVAIYASKTGMPAEEITALMDAETYYTAAEAKAAGLCDVVSNPARKPAASASARAIDIENMRRRARIAVAR